MEKVAPNSKFVRNFTEIIWQSQIKGPLTFSEKNSLKVNFDCHLNCGF